MKYRALSSGTIGAGPAVRRVRAGEVFDIPDGVKPGKWMEPVPEDAPVKVEAKGKGKCPQTFSEIAKSDAKAATPKGAEGLV